jgi:hypothetical protein
MINGGMRRIVVIKNIPSDMIEEAILILKNKPFADNPGAAAVTAGGNKKKDNSFILKEAEAIINNYMKDSNMKLPDKKRPGARKIWGSRFNSVNIAINLALVGSIALLIFIITRMI